VIALLRIACVLVVLLGAAPARAADPEELLHLLGYVAADYPGAVSGGEIVSEPEYDEQLRILDQAAKMAASLGGAPLAADVRALRAAVEAKASDAAIVAAVRALERAVIAATGVDPRPPRVPDRERGRALFRDLCAACHGATGRADGPKARELSPAPISFQDPVALEVLSPARVAGAVRFGVLGTAMAGFPGLSEADRWDLGFYVLTLRHTPRRAPRTPRHALAELAARSDGELLDGLFAAGAAEHELGSMLADLRTQTSYAADATPTAQARAALFDVERSLVLGTRGEDIQYVVAVAARPLRELRRALQLADPALAAEIDERFLALRARAPTDPLEHLLRDLEVLRRALARADLELAGPPSPGDPLSGVPAQRPRERPLDAVFDGARAALRHTFGAAVAVVGAVLAWRGRRDRRSRACAAGALLAVGLLPGVGGAPGGVVRAVADIARAVAEGPGTTAVLGLVLGLAAVAAAVGLAVRHGRASPFRDDVSSAALAFAAAAHAGHLIWFAQLRGLLPSAHLLFFAGAPAVGLYPTVEACAGQLVAWLSVLLLMRRSVLSAGARADTVAS
jgi:mono/diheme cytochrome c family protein